MAIVFAAVLTLLSSRAHAAVYWTDGSGLSRANTNGSELDSQFIAVDPEPVGHAVAYAACEGVAVDASHIYWSEPDRGSIARANLDGSGIEYHFLSGLENPCGVAVDGSSIYWAEEGGGAIGKSNLAGGGVNRAFISGLVKPCGVAVGDGYLYYTAEHSVARVALSGGIPQLIHQEENSSFCGVAVDKAHVYWGGFEERIGRAELDGADPEPFFINGTERPCGIALDGSRIYWTVNEVQGSIQDSDLQGGARRGNDHRSGGLCPLRNRR